MKFIKEALRYMVNVKWYRSTGHGWRKAFELAQKTIN